MARAHSRSDYDTVIIGAGIGGLISAAKLAREGKHVLVIERHSTPGGYASSFKRKKFVFEAALHAVDGMFNPNNPNLEILAELGITDNLTFIRLPEFYHVSRGDFSFTLSDNMEEAFKQLHHRFPSEQKAITKYCHLLENLRREILRFPEHRGKLLAMLPLVPVLFPSIVKNMFASLESFMRRLTDNENLKIALCANTSYYHTDPSAYSMLHYGGAQSTYLNGGCAYIQGGSQRLADYLAGYIQARNGSVLLNHSVDSIMFSGKRASGVTFHAVNGTGEARAESVSAEFIVANANIPSVINAMLPASEGVKLRSRFNRYRLSHSAFCLYLGLKKPLSAIGNRYYSTFFLPENLKSLRDMHCFNTTNDFTKKILILVDYSLIQADLSSGNHPTASIIVVDSIAHWNGLSAGEYREKKERMCRVLIDALERHLPGSRSLIDYYEAATPITMARYTSNPEGCIYGYAQSVNQVGPNRPGQYSSIPGLFFASAWTKPGGGITPVIKSGYTAAQNILRVSR